MKPTRQQRTDFLAHRPLPDVKFEHNVYVHVVTGTYQGDAGSIVSVEELGSDPLYLVELESGKDARISQSSLRLPDA
jgi:ribosomal protein S4E